MLEFFEIVAHAYAGSDDGIMIVFLAVGSLIVGSILGRDPKSRRDRSKA
jgi:hypothetical protein